MNASKVNTSTGSVQLMAEHYILKKLLKLVSELYPVTINLIHLEFLLTSLRIFLSNFKRF